MTMQLSEADVRPLLDMPALIDRMERALAAFSRGRVDQPVRAVVDVSPGRGFLGVMPAHLRDENSLGAKLVTVFHHNAQYGLPSHMATILLFDPETGALLAIMDGRYITEVRTAAVSAVSAKLLARPGAATLGILGSGVQARSHVEAMRHVLDLKEVRAWSPNRERLQKFAAESGAKACVTAAEAVRGMDVVVMATSSTTPALDVSWVAQGAHVISVGACRPNQRELDPQLIAQSRLFLDSRQAAVQESGDIILGGFQDHIVGELGEVIDGTLEGRRSDSEITVFKSLGLAVEDVAAARLVYDRALAAKTTS